MNHVKINHLNSLPLIRCEDSISALYAKCGFMFKLVSAILTSPGGSLDGAYYLLERPIQLFVIALQRRQI